jgi:hypothetical protein
VGAPVFTPDGTPLSQDEIASAIAGGAARFDTGAEYELTDPSGRPRLVAGSDVWKALKSGWELESDEQKALKRYRQEAGISEAIKAGAEGAASTATFGLSTQAAAAIGGDEYKAAARLREKEFSTARGVGEVLGLVAPWGAEALAARGIGTAARIATAAPRLVSRAAGAAGEAAARLAPGAGRIGQVVGGAARVGAEGAVEGAAFSVGRLVEDNALRDRELSIENVLAAAGSGAKTGALLGAGLGAAAPVARVLGEKAARGAASLLPSGEGLAGRFAFRATGATGSQVQRLGLKRAESSGQRLLDEGLVRVEGLPMRAERIAAATKQAGAELGSVVGRLDDTGIKADLAGFVGKADEHLRKLRASGLEADLKLADRIERQWVADLRGKLEKGESATWKELHARRARMDDYVQGKKGPAGDELKKLRRELEGEFETQAERAANAAGGELAGSYQAAKSRYADLIAASHVATQRAAAISGHALPSLRAAIGGAGVVGGGIAALGAGPGAVAGLVTTAGIQAFVKHGDSAIALALDKLSALKKLEQEANKSALRIASDTQAAVRSTGVSAKHQLPAAVVKTQQEYERHTELARAYQANPAKAAAMVGNELGATDRVAPKASSQMAAVRAQDAAYLASKLPPQMQRALPGPPDASPGKMAAVTRAAVALENPQSVAAEMRENRLSPEAAEALRERRPEIHEAMVRNAATVIAEMAKRGEIPNYQARIQLSMLTGVPMDPSLEPRRIKMIQKLVHEQGGAAAPAPPSSGGGEGARRMAGRRSVMAEEIESIVM